MAKIKVRKFNISKSSLEKTKKDPLLQMFIEKIGVKPDDLRTYEDVYIDTDKVVAVGDICQNSDGEGVFNIYFAADDSPKPKAWQICEESYDKFMKAWLGN